MARCRSLVSSRVSFFFQAEDGIRYVAVTGVQTCFFFFQAEDGIRDVAVTGVQTCALPIYLAENFKLPREKLVRIYNPVDIEWVRELARIGGNPFCGPGDRKSVV